MLSWLVVSPAEKTSSDIWWIGKVVVPLHSQLKRTGFRKCLSLMSGEQVLLVSVTLGAPINNRYKTREWGARKKTSPKIWWFQKVVVPLHSQLQRKGGRKCSIHDWSLVAMIADRSACGVYVMTRSSSRSRSFLNTSFWYSEIDRRKKLLQKFGGFKNLSYLCTHNPREKAVRSSHVKRSWAGASNERLFLRRL